MAIAEIFLTAFVQVLFEKLTSRDLWNFARRERIDTLLTKWSRMLEQIGAVLADAEEKQMTNQLGIKSWLEDLEDLAYDLDDVADEFATEALRRKVMEEPRASTSKVRALVPTCCMSFKPSAIAFGFRMGSQIDDITTRLRDLFDRRAGLGLQHVVAGPTIKAPQRPPTSSLIHEPRLYGRDGDKTAIIELLLGNQSSNEKVGVVPIVGMGGVGKTTLAQMVYNDEMVTKHFEIKAWVCVSEVFDILGVTKAILESVTSQTCEFKALNQVQVQIKKALAGKKFLIILDDVWSKNHNEWSILKSPFNDGAVGSKVIVTTRISDVALMMVGSDKFHSLKELSDDDCWFVFAQHAFENRSTNESPNLVSIGRKIVRKCRGLPLAARTLGGLLRCKLRDYEWEEVLNDKLWELSDKESQILPALRLSYYHLPSHLKKCFAYCSILPKDYEFEEKELIFLWMAEGLIRKPTGQKQMEDLGCEYFRELLSRSLFQPSSSSGKVSQFVMHDLINDVAHFVARRICFRLEEKLENSEGDRNVATARHSSYIRGRCDGIRKFEAFQKAKNLRTFLPIGLRDRAISSSVSYLNNDVPLHLLPSLRRLRVLSLRRYKTCELSSSIGDMKHVRFLDLSCALIAALPESIGTLYNLQTLILRDCKNLNKLPSNTSNLVKLRHLDVTGANSLKQMPQNIGNLTSLQTLSNFIVSHGDGSTIKELGNLIHLRGTLCISGLENVEDALDSRRANLKDKVGLDVLSMKWSNVADNSRVETVESEVLDMLKPHKKIKDLTISGYHGPTFPTWVGNSLYCNMVSLKFQNCDKCTSLPPLGQLPSLENLHIKGMKAIENVGLEFYGLGCSHPFPALQNLTFEEMLEWKDWSSFGVDEGAQAFARLSKLSIKRCPKFLGKLPCNLPCLRELDIEQCTLLVVSWVPSPIEQIEVRNTLHFDSLTSLSLKNVSIPNSFHNSEVANEAAMLENARSSHLSSVTSLRVENIQGLTSLWKNEVGQKLSPPALRRLVIKFCPQLTSLFEEEEEGLQQQKQRDERHYIMMLEYLEIRNCEKLEKLPQVLHNLKSLREFNLNGIPGLISFPKTGLPSALRKLQIANCDALRSLPELMTLNCLENLEISNCPSLTYLSLKTGLPPTLKKLCIECCPNLESVIAEKVIRINCPSLEEVEISECENLKSLPDVVQNNYNGGCLRGLIIWDYDNVESIPEGWFTSTNLSDLGISCKRLKGLPQHYNLASLEGLGLSSCGGAGKELISYGLKEESFTNLSRLSLRDVDLGSKRTASEWGLLHRLSSLRILILTGYGWASFLPPEEEEDGILWLPPSLTGLFICEFPNLEKLSSKDFQNIPSLEQLEIERCPKLTTITKLGLLSSLLDLWIWDCPNLASFSAEEQGLRLPPSLLQLWISKCPKLKERCEKGEGEYWPLISHIPKVRIDYDSTRMSLAQAARKWAPQVVRFTSKSYEKRRLFYVSLQGDFIEDDFAPREKDTPSTGTVWH